MLALVFAALKATTVVFFGSAAIDEVEADGR